MWQQIYKDQNLFEIQATSLICKDELRSDPEVLILIYGDYIQDCYKISKHTSLCSF